MAQAWTEVEREVLKQDPLHDVKEEIQHQTPHLRHVDLPEGDGSRDTDTQMEEVVKSHVPEAFAAELKKDHAMTQPATDFEETEVEFMEDDPLHDVKQELEHHSPHLRHIESPYSPGHHPPASPGGGDVVKSEVPPPFEEELKNDHDIVKGHPEESSLTPKEESEENQPVFTVRDPTFIGLRRGVRPRSRVSANVGNRPGRTALIHNPETANMCVKDEPDHDDHQVEESNDPKSAENTSQNDASVATNPFGSLGIPARGTPHFRISAHQGMRPGGPLSRDLKLETSTESGAPIGGDGAGADLSADMKPKGPGLPMGTSGPRRGGLARGSGVPGGDQKLVGSGGGGGSLARTGSGVPGEQRLGGGGLARQGSGIPGEQRLGGGGLARTGSGVPGNSLARLGSGAFGGLARTGSGIPTSKGGNDLNDFSSFLDSDYFPKQETEDDNGGDQKGVFGKLGGKISEKWNQVNSYGSPGQEVPKGTTEEVATGEVVRSADGAASRNLLDVERAVQ
ncbi:unnamed protein product [Calypogeia fissa]